MEKIVTNNTPNSPIHRIIPNKSLVMGLYPVTINEEEQEQDEHLQDRDDNHVEEIYRQVKPQLAIFHIEKHISV